MVSEFLGITAALTGIIAARYLLLSGLFYWLLWRRGGEKLKAKRLNRDRPIRAIIMQEIRLSLISSVVYAVPAAITLVALLHGGTAVYYDWRAYGGVPYLFLSFFIYLAVQDTYYYWAHRVLHHPRLTGWLLPAMVFVIPIHIALLVALLMFMSMVAVFNHSGWEILPRWLVHGPIGGQLISATHHSYHHIRFDKNYGLYFRFWDRIMGTDTMPQETPPSTRLSMRPGRA
jgi:lathosterol oxidase